MGQSQTDTKSEPVREREASFTPIPDRELRGIVARFRREKAGGIIERLVRNIEAARGEANRFEALWKQLHDAKIGGKRAGELLDRMPPHSLEAELAVLGSVLVMPTIFPALRKLLEPDDFYCVQNQAIYKRMMKLDDDAKPIDTLLMAEALRQSGEYAMVGGAVRLAEILEGCPTARNFVYYARIVKAEARKRAFIALAMWLVRESHSDRHADEVGDELRERLAGL